MRISEIYQIFKKNPVICTDSRKVKKGSLFFALKGKTFNGNVFAEKAISSGCVFSIIDDKEYASNNKTILVENVLETLQNLARIHRKQLNIPIIGITGTNGKTTSKELIYSVLNSRLICYATKGNLNNHIGVPLSILEISKNHEIAVIEMGANHKNDIDFLCNITKPTHGVITNIGSAHLEGFKNIQGVIDTKKELYDFIKKKNGLIFINDDDQLLNNLSKNIDKMSYGQNSNLKISISNSNPFLNLKWTETNIKSNLIGEYQFYNISLAICIGVFFKVSIHKIKRAIESYIPKNNRSEITKTDNNTIILDAYNANPSSMKAMLDYFANQKSTNKLCILGDMLEMGKYSMQEHTKIIKICNELKLEVLFVGEEFSKLSNKAFKKLVDIKSYIKKNPIKNKNILLKGSRGVKLEELVDYL